MPRTIDRDRSWVPLLFPYALLFLLFIVVPVAAAVALSFTYFNTIQPPGFTGLRNYVVLLTQDEVFMQKVLPNTISFALIVGPGGYLLSFVLAWMLAQVPRSARTVLAIIIYSPSMTVGVIMATVWTVVFNGSSQGYLNSLLLRGGFLAEPIQWLQSPLHLPWIMVFVSLWGSMGVGFLAMLAGILNVNRELYEAAWIDGMRNRVQEILYITIPSTRPQMLFGAVMAIVGTFGASSVGVQLSGSNPTPEYAGQLIVNHIEDYGFLRYEMGYAAAISVVLLALVYVLSRVSWKVFGED